ncbi:MAG: hypothetical protein IPP91_17075 [Betaproteobacteria bacterium]|nr:hypothetical protein [Betaproteobacteria bacterium]
MPIERDQEQCHSELLALYNASVAEIGGFKQQQLGVTNYSIALFAALVAVKQLFGVSISWERAVLAILVIAAAAFAAVVQCQLWAAIQVRRARLRSIRSKFSATFRDSWDHPKGDDALHWLLPFVVGVGGLVAFWVIAK